MGAITHLTTLDECNKLLASKRGSLVVVRRLSSSPSPHLICLDHIRLEYRR